MKKDVTCKELCAPIDITAENAKFITSLIQRHYNMNWLVDGLPAGTKTMDTKSNTEYYSIGFEMGNAKSYAFYTHYDINILYHEQSSSKTYRIVGVLVTPKRYSQPHLNEY